MRMVSRWTVLPLLCLMSLTACAGQGQWKAKKIATIEGFQTPESVVPTADGKTGYVSNVQAGEDGPWADDGQGYVSKLKLPGKVAKRKWRTGKGKAQLNGPKGLCIVNGYLWMSDNTRVVRFKLGGGKKGGQVISIPGAKKLNDMATDGEHAYVSDMGTGNIYRIHKKGKVQKIRGPEAVNGITFGNDRMYAVSWGRHEVYEVDPAGKREPRPLGLARHFKSLDGVEVLDSGAMIVSDFLGGKVSVISPKGKVKTLIEMKTPADIGIDRERMRLYVPSLKGNFLNVYKLHR